MNWMANKKSLDTELDGGVIYGYITNPTNEVQLGNYLAKHGVVEVIPFIKERFETIAILTNMSVEEEYRGDGLGTELLEGFIDDAVEKQAEAIILVADTGENNEFNLVEWYEEYGFEIIHGHEESFPVMLRKMNSVI